MTPPAACQRRRIRITHPRDHLMSSTSLPLSIAPEVAAARERGGAIVALESTIITHGMPYPQNLAMAREVEGIVRQAGAVPATIAVMDGELKVGLTEADLERLAKEGRTAAKA